MSYADFKNFIMLSKALRLIIIHVFGKGLFFTNLKSKAGERESDTYWFTLQMTATVRTGPG